MTSDADFPGDGNIVGRIVRHRLDETRAVVAASEPYVGRRGPGIRVTLRSLDSGIDMGKWEMRYLMEWWVIEGEKG